MRNIVLIFLLVLLFILSMSLNTRSIAMMESEVTSKSDEIKLVEGFFKGIREDKLIIGDRETYTHSSFTLSPEVKVIYRGKVVEREELLIDSIIKATIVNDIVTEIELVEVSS